MTKPKQIIYPMRYVGLPGAAAKSSERDFASAFAALLGGNVYVHAIGRARAGLYLLAKLAISGSRRRVVMSSYTIPDVVNMVRFAGAEPIFVDVLPNSTNLDLDQLRNVVDETVCCVIVTHYHVNQDLGAIRTICQTKGVMLVDDCALALGASEPLGQIGATTDASVFSFSGFKALNYFWGGAITTRSSELARKANDIISEWARLNWKDYAGQALKLFKYDYATRNLVFAKLTFPLLRKKVLAGTETEILPLVRVESHSITSTIVSRPSVRAFEEWNRKIRGVDTFLRHRRLIASIYDEQLSHRMVSKETYDSIRAGSCWVNYPISVDPDSRTDVYKKIVSQGFDVGLSLYPNIQEMPAFADVPGRTVNTAALVRSALYLPTHPGISEEYAKRLATTAAAAVL